MMNWTRVPDSGGESLYRLAKRFVSIKHRILSLKAEREYCEWMEPSEMFGEDATGYPGRPECFAADEPGPVREWCEPCQRNQARYLLRRHLVRKLWRTQARMLKAGA